MFIQKIQLSYENYFCIFVTWQLIFLFLFPLFFPEHMKFDVMDHFKYNQWNPHLCNNAKKISEKQSSGIMLLPVDVKRR